MKFNLLFHFGILRLLHSMDPLQAVDDMINWYLVLSVRMWSSIHVLDPHSDLNGYLVI